MALPAERPRLRYGVVMVMVVLLEAGVGAGQQQRRRWLVCPEGGDALRVAEISWRVTDIREGGGGGDGGGVHVAVLTVGEGRA